MLIGRGRLFRFAKPFFAMSQQPSSDMAEFRKALGKSSHVVVLTGLDNLEKFWLRNSNFRFSSVGY